MVANDQKQAFVDQLGLQYCPRVELRVVSYEDHVQDRGVYESVELDTWHCEEKKGNSYENSSSQKEYERVEEGSVVR